MLQAAIDIGSNSVRLLIGELCHGRIVVTQQGLHTTRLGASKVGSALPDSAVCATITALADFVATAASYGIAVDKIRAVATSAVREASNGAEFAQEVHLQTGLNLQILAGEQEAELSFLGAVGMVPQAFGVIDVGGGSTELFYRGAAGKLQGASVPVGAVRLQCGEITAPQIRPLLASLTRDLPRGQHSYVAVGGTITSIAALAAGLTVYTREAVQGQKISVPQLQKYRDELAPLSGAQRRLLYPLLAERSEIIVDGLDIYLCLLNLLEISELTVSDAGILDGIIFQTAQL